MDPLGPNPYLGQIHAMYDLLTLVVRRIYEEIPPKERLQLMRDPGKPRALRFKKHLSRFFQWKDANAILQEPHMVAAEMKLLTSWLIQLKTALRFDDFKNYSEKVHALFDLEQPDYDVRLIYYRALELTYIEGATAGWLVDVLYDIDQMGAAPAEVIFHLKPYVQKHFRALLF
jgi:hypothetical protein